MRIVSSIVRKPYISEMDLLRLQKTLLLDRIEELFAARRDDSQT
jgi:hypothetical protein